MIESKEFDGKYSEEEMKEHKIVGNENYGDRKSLL